MIGLIGMPLGGGPSPVSPGPGTNGELLGTMAGELDDEELLDDSVVSGADELLGGTEVLLSDADELVGGVGGLVCEDELVGGTVCEAELLGGTVCEAELLGGTVCEAELVGGTEDVLGVPHGPWLRLN